MRQLDQQLGRWHSIDLMAEMYDDQTPYQYGMNNPISNIDVDGMSTEDDNRRHEEDLENIAEFLNNAQGDDIAGGGGKKGHVYNPYTKKWEETHKGNSSSSRDSTGAGSLQTAFAQAQNDNDKPRPTNTQNNQNSGQGKSNSGEWHVVETPQTQEQGDVQKAGMDGDEHLIGPGLILLGERITALKPVGALGSRRGSSVASYTLSKALPRTFTKTLGKKVGTKVATRLGTNVMGRALGRFVPYAGWGLTLYDVYDNRVAIGQFMYDWSHMEWPNGAPNAVKMNDGSIMYVCFLAGTQILTTKALKSIEKIVVGDSVYSYNLEKNLVELSKITKFLKRHTQEIYEVVTDNQKILVTAEHPFYVEEKGWVRVKNLQSGFILKTKGNTKERIISVTLKETPETVYNIEVEGNHNYFVTNSNILVHNK